MFNLSKITVVYLLWEHPKFAKSQEVYGVGNAHHLRVARKIK
jgi:hypothetical protein